MMQITEDTPPDMLAGAMDLTVHLPDGNAVKMSVERSTPMMDLLVQITTANHLQLSNHTLQALGMAPSSEHSDRILPFKPNTPIGTLDTQHIRVLPKGRTLPAPKYTAPGHQPFESTFRLKVHLPRNQLYVTRVSRNVLLEDIMKKVCEEKNLDPLKYEFKHPGNLDQVLDPKLTLSDYQITEIYVVIKGTTNLSQAFSAADIMVLRKEEERKQMHTKTGGGVFNLIFKRGKSSMGSGSVSSENRSISPTHSDDSRSVTPPAVQPPIVAPPKKEPPPDKPKPPQRKRRPAPKPPQIQVGEVSNENGMENGSSVVSNEDPSNHSTLKSSENGLTICHSRNSSDSSGYHEASILSDHCANTSLPRTRPKSAFVGDQVQLQSTSNLNKMSEHSRSTTSLMAGRKKKAAPPPPPVPVSPANSVVAQSEKPSPLVASQPDISTHKESSEVLETTLTSINNPVPKPRTRTSVPRAPPRPRPNSETFESIKEYSLSISSSRNSSNEDLLKKVERDIEEKLGIKEDEFKSALNKDVVESVVRETLGDHVPIVSQDTPTINQIEDSWLDVDLRKPKIEHSFIENDKEHITDVPLETASHLNYDSLEFSTEDVKESKLEFHLGQTEDKSKIINSEEEFITLSSEQKIAREDFRVEEMLASLEVINPFNQDKEQENTNSQDKLIQDKQGIKSANSTTIFNVQKSVISNIFTSEEFLNESKPPEIVGLIPKTPQEAKKHSTPVDSLGKKKSFQIDDSLLDHSYDSESISSHRSGGTKSSKNSVASAIDTLDDEILDLDENMFTGSLSKASTKRRPEAFNQLFGMHKYDSETDQKLYRNTSVVSLPSVNGVPELDRPSMKKWDSTENLNSVSLNYYGVRNKWVSGDASDSESIASTNLTPAQTPRDSLPPCPVESSTPVKIQSEEKSLESNDSGIAQDTHSHKEGDEEEFGFHTPPPPPILNDIQQEEISSVKTDGSSVNPPNTVKEESNSINSSVGQLTDISNRIKSVERSSTKELQVLIGPVKPPVPKTSIPSPPITEQLITPDVKKQEPTPSSNTVKQSQSETGLIDIDWHYQLPSPPKAFRDSSPEHIALSEANSVTDYKDSVVTSPELFEKLRTLEDSQFEKDTVKSEVTSIGSEEPLNMLSLEHLEKRKSLVYNRELATSLKMTDNLETSTKTKDNFTSSVTSFQTNYNELNKAPVQQHQPPKPARTTSSSSLHALPNFKITTYDVPKQNITVFEDDTISSNTHTTSTLTRNKLGRSMDNISFAKKTLGNESSNNNEREYKFYRPQSSNFGTLSAVSRSESFSTDQRLPLKPVSRSKSTLTINKPPVSNTNESDISRSNSLFDVSGLQSLEVMKLIQNKLNTPTGSMENINYRDKMENQYVPQKILPEEVTEPPEVIEPQPLEEKPQASSPQPVKKYYYRGPPAVNMTTWSERPKVPVSVKEDEDYTLGNVNTSKLIVNTTNNNITSNNSVEVRNIGYEKSSSHLKESEHNVSVNVNGTNQILQPSNNVVIKIGGTRSNNYLKNMENQRFLGPTAYRKPFSNINQNGSSVTSTQRPHSIALPSDFDISRVPVVRSVEFKKPFKDFHGSNTSITHINHGNDDFRSLHHSVDSTETFTDKFRNSANLKSTERQDSENKRVFRVGGFKPLENNSAPVIRGFKPSDRDPSHRLSWNPSSSYNTLPAKPKVEKDFTPNQHVPFSQSTLKRTASSKIYTADQNYNDISKDIFKEDQNRIENNSYNSLPSTVTQNKMKVAAVPPPPPQMPKVTLRKVSPQEAKGQTSPLDARDMLLNSIRNFGGKKGLRAVKA